jgi:hypothetical protein
MCSVEPTNRFSVEPFGTKHYLRGQFILQFTIKMTEQHASSQLSYASPPFRQPQCVQHTSAVGSPTLIGETLKEPQLSPFVPKREHVLLVRIGSLSPAVRPRLHRMAQRCLCGCLALRRKFSQRFAPHLSHRSAYSRSKLAARDPNPAVSTKTCASMSLSGLNNTFESLCLIVPLHGPIIK